jgi:hypothetical protein
VRRTDRQPKRNLLARARSRVSHDARPRTQACPATQTTALAHVASDDNERGTLLAKIDDWEPALDLVAADLDTILRKRTTTKKAQTHASA